MKTSIGKLLASFQTALDDYIDKFYGVYRILFSAQDVKLTIHKFKKGEALGPDSIVCAG